MTEHLIAALCGNCHVGIGSIATDDGLRCAACWMAGARDLDFADWKENARHE